MNKNLLQAGKWKQKQEECLWEETEERITLCEQRERDDSDTSRVIMGHRIIEKALLYDGKRVDKNAAGVLIRGLRSMEKASSC
jgi:hypothetical protein